MKKEFDMLKEFDIGIEFDNEKELFDFENEFDIEHEPTKMNGPNGLPYYSNILLIKHVVNNL